LDYYSHTAFEFVTTSLGSQGTVLAGGRYEGLVAEMGGPSTPAVGWAAGIERLSMLIGALETQAAPVAVIPAGDAGQNMAITILSLLRNAGFRSEMAYRGNMKKRMERANRIGASWAVIIGEEEVERGIVRLKNLADGSQKEVAPEILLTILGDGEAAGA
jgi:histidyl-tRNA synthetase